MRIVLQARTASARQPAKSLLPLGGLPLAILCAKRLQRGDAEVLLATSDDPTDDLLADTAARAGVAVFRGQLTDVLSRFVASVSDLKDDDVVVRMTADNPVPDGEFVERLVRSFLRQNVSYLGTRWPEDMLPFGVGGEVFTAGSLRYSAARAATPYDREHVTPFLARAESAGILTAADLGRDVDRANLRCTIDTLDDYLAMARVFARIADPVNMGWQSLIPLLPASPREGVSSVPSIDRNGESFGRVVLGTVQFGMDYGIANRTGRPPDDELRAIIVAADEAGVTHLDTARAYGDAEARIGAVFAMGDSASIRVISKLAPLDMLGRHAHPEVVHEAVDASVFRSCHALHRRKIDVMMLHRFKDMLQWNGAALDRLTTLIGEGVIGTVGVSVYTPAEAIRALADPRIQHIQIPFNLLDGRWLSTEFQAALSVRPSVAIHARSVFLQGLLINPATIWPAWVRRAGEFVAKITQLCADLDRRSPADLCMAYVSACPWVATMVLGVERFEQLEEILALASQPPLSAAEVDMIRGAFPSVPARLLNPAKW